jgi:hypothetical protein
MRGTAAAARSIATFPLVVASLVAGARPALAAHRVAAVDSSAELARALTVALSPWDVDIVQVDAPLPDQPTPVDRQRAIAIAHEAGADVVLWISATDDGSAVWIYEAASDRMRVRALRARKPYDAPTAAAVALAVKALLDDGTVARVPESAPPGAGRAAAWSVGVALGAALHGWSSSPVEARFGAGASVWPSVFGGYVGLLAEASGGSGFGASSRVARLDLVDTALRVALGLRLPLTQAIALQGSAGAGAHLFVLGGTLAQDGTSIGKARVDGAFEPRLGVDAHLGGTRIHIQPWVGLSLLTRWQHFRVHGITALDVSPWTLEGATSVAWEWP